jgi:hypothetical protein
MVRYDAGMDGGSGCVGWFGDEWEGVGGWWEERESSVDHVGKDYSFVHPIFVVIPHFLSFFGWDDE